MLTFCNFFVIIIGEKGILFKKGGDYMVKSKAEILGQVKAIIGDDTSDNSLNLLSDISDTIDDLETKSNGDGEDWKKKYEENDAQWRQKYKERFFAPVDDKKQTEEDKILNADETKEPQLKTNFDELFK